MPHTTPAAKEELEIDVDPRGDVIFVGNDPFERYNCGSVTVRIRASSAVLMAMSSVFASMLGPHFKDGQQLRSNSTVEIALQEKNPRAMEILLNVLHLKSSAIPDEPMSFHMVDVARLADKYLCTEQLGFVARVWVKILRGKSETTDLGRLLTICFHLNMAEYFGHASRALVMRSRATEDLTVSSITYGVDRDQKLGFIRAFSILNNYKNRCFHDIQAFVASATNVLVRARVNFPEKQCHDRCNVVEYGLYDMMNLLDKHGLDAETLKYQRLDEALKGLESMPDFPYSDRVEPCSVKCIYYDLRRNAILRTFRSVAKRNTPPSKLLCLEGHHKSGEGKDYCYQCGVGCCKHCNYAGFECYR